MYFLIYKRISNCLKWAQQSGLLQSRWSTKEWEFLISVSVRVAQAHTYTQWNTPILSLLFPHLCILQNISYREKKNPHWGKTKPRWPEQLLPSLVLTCKCSGLAFFFQLLMKSDPACGLQPACPGGNCLTPKWVAYAGDLQHSPEASMLVDFPVFS